MLWYIGRRPRNAEAWSCCGTLLCDSRYDRQALFHRSSPFIDPLGSSADAIRWPTSRKSNARLFFPASLVVMAFSQRPQNPHYERQQFFERLKVAGLSRRHMFNPPRPLTALHICLFTKLHDEGA